jgi:hypothetical protein
MPEKAVAMEAWTEALIEAYLKAGGKMPLPIEGQRYPPGGSAPGASITAATSIAMNSGTRIAMQAATKERAAR